MREPVIYNLFGDSDLFAKLIAATKGTGGALTHRTFPDGESYVRVEDDVTGRDVILITSLDHPGDKILPLLFAAKTLSDLGAKRVGLVTPYLPYMRQDKSFETGEAVTTRQFANILSDEFDWLLTVDPHLHRIKNLDEIYVMETVVVNATSVIADWVKKNVKNPIIIGPDGESNQWASTVANQLGVPFVVARKDRCGDNCVEIDLPDASNHNGRTPVIVDDIISTAGTMIEAVVSLKRQGLNKPICIGIHSLFGESVEDILRETGAADVVTCNTIAHATNKIDVSGLIGKAVKKFVKTPYEKPFRRYV